MAEPKPDKPGFFSRLFGRQPTTETKPAAASHEVVSETAVPVEPKPGEPGLVFTDGRTDPSRRSLSSRPISPGRRCRTSGRRDRRRRSSAGGGAGQLRCATHRTSGRAAKLVAAPVERHEAHLLVPVRERHRPLHQAQARRGDARRARGRAGARRSRARHRHADHRGGVGRTLRPGNLARRGQGDPCRARSRRRSSPSPFPSPSTARRSPT